ASADGAEVSAVLIAVDEAGEQVGDFISGADVARAEAAATVSVATEEEIALARERTIEVELTAEDVGAELEGVLALGPGERVIEVYAGLRQEVGAEITGVFDLIVVAADEGDASEQRCVAIDDAEIVADRRAVAGGHVTVRGADKSSASLVDDGSTKRVRPADGETAGMIEVGTGTEAGG